MLEEEFRGALGEGACGGREAAWAAQTQTPRCLGTSAVRPQEPTGLHCG